MKEKIIFVSENQGICSICIEVRLYVAFKEPMKGTWCLDRHKYRLWVISLYESISEYDEWYCRHCTGWLNSNDKFLPNDNFEIRR